MKYTIFVITVITLLGLGSCRNDFDDIIVNNGQLEFSTDSIHLDTLLVKVEEKFRSSTKQFTIRNTSDEDIVIPEIKLGKGDNSFYTLNINGLPGPDTPKTASSGKIFENVEILANDQIFGFVETIVDLENVNDTAELNSLLEDGEYKDEIVFESPNGNQDIKLFTRLIESDFVFNDTDATDARPIKEIITTQRDDQGEFIVLKAYNLNADELMVSRDKALVISGYAVVPSGEEMIIKAGSRIHFKENPNGEPQLNQKAGLIIEDGAILTIEGEISMDPKNPEENLVIIEGARIDEDFDILPGQWDFIWIQKGGKADIKNCIIKNAITPIFIEGNGDETEASLNLENVQIYNAAAAGIQATATNITAKNVVIDQSGKNSLNIEEGGTYNFNHCTIANYFRFGFSGVAVGLNNTKKTDSTLTDSDLDIKFVNCIIDGPGFSEIRVTNSAEANFNLSFENCLIKTSRFNSSEPLLDINNNSVFTNCIFNEDADFKDTKFNQLFIGEKSAANGKAKIDPDALPNDIVNTVRNTTSPDIGAYESISFEEEEMTE